MRLGWVAADRKIIEQMIIAKQATDLHSNFLSQRIIYQFLMDNDLDNHIRQIIDAYKNQRDQMVDGIKKYFPTQVKFTIPIGGMFVWVSLPAGCNTFELLKKATEAHVAFVPGGVFFLEGKGQNTMRLNFSNTESKQMDIGLQRLGKMLYEYLKDI